MSSTMAELGTDVWLTPFPPVLGKDSIIVTLAMEIVKLCSHKSALQHATFGRSHEVP